MRKIVLLGLLLLCALLVVACQDEPLGSNDFTITVDADGERVAYRFSKRISVGQFLDEVGVLLGEYDEVNPLPQTQIRDGMRITVTRVVYREECETEDLPFDSNRIPHQGVQPGEERLGQVGIVGKLEICYRIMERDGEQVSRDRIGNGVMIEEPQDEIIWVYSAPLDTLIPIDGILTYISGGQAWIIEDITTNYNPLTEDGFLDGRVFDLSPDGRRLLYTRSSPNPDDPEFSNELWAIVDTTAPFPQAVQLLPEDVRVGQWVPGVPTYTVSYSTAQPRDEGAGWQAYNDLYLADLSPDTGAMLSNTLEIVISQNALGSFAYWGRRFMWSPDGQYLAWANADSVGLVNLDTGEFEALLTFAEYAPLL
ncbi:MAG: G5 domain-containing protein, partial [Anaerolineae bacterium]|nr:G5 domain-containing protein [Anaerolineae bacterium]